MQQYMNQRNGAFTPSWSSSGLDDYIRRSIASPKKVDREESEGYKKTPMPEPQNGPANAWTNIRANCIPKKQCYIQLYGWLRGLAAPHIVAGLYDQLKGTWELGRKRNVLYM